MLHQSNVNAIKNVLDLTMTTPTTISTMTTTISTEKRDRDGERKEKIMTCRYTLLCETGKACRPIFNGSKKQAFSRFNLLTMV